MAAIFTWLSAIRTWLVFANIEIKASGANANPYHTFPTTVNPSAALSVAFVVTILKKCKASEPSIASAPSNLKFFAAAVVKAEATLSKLATSKPPFQVTSAAETVIVAAAAPNVKVGLVEPLPKHTIVTPALSATIFVSVTVSACFGKT